MGASRPKDTTDSGEPITPRLGHRHQISNPGLSQTPSKTYSQNKPKSMKCTKEVSQKRDSYTSSKK